MCPAFWLGSHTAFSKSIRRVFVMNEVVLLVQPSSAIAVSVSSERCFIGCMVRFTLILGTAASVGQV